MLKNPHKTFLAMGALFAASACVNIKGLQNPSIPRELGNNRYIVGVGLQSKSDLILAMYNFCDQQKRFYQEISDSGIQLTFACLSEDERPFNKPTREKQAVKTLY